MAKVYTLTDEQIEAWFATHFQGNRIAQDEQNYNIAYAAKDALKAIGAAPAAAAPTANTENA